MCVYPQVSHHQHQTLLMPSVKVDFRCFYLLQSLKEQNVFARILKPLALLFCFGMHNLRLAVIVCIIIRVISLRTN